MWEISGNVPRLGQLLPRGKRADETIHRLSTSHGGFIYQASFTGQGATLATVDSGSDAVSVDVAKQYILLNISQNSSYSLSNNCFIIYFIINFVYSTRITSSLTIWVQKTEAAINRDEGNYELPHGYNNNSCLTAVIFFSQKEASLLRLFYTAQSTSWASTWKTSSWRERRQGIYAICNALNRRKVC